MSADIIIRDKLIPTREHGSVLLYVHGNHKARSDGKPRTATSTLTQLLNSEATLGSNSIVIHSVNQRLLTNRPGSDTCDLFSRLLARKITKGIHSCTPALTEPPNTDQNRDGHGNDAHTAIGQQELLRRLLLAASTAEENADGGRHGQHEGEDHVVPGHEVALLRHGWLSLADAAVVLCWCQ